MPIVHDPKTGQFTRGGTVGSARKVKRIEGLNEAQSVQHANFMSHSTKVVKARYLSMIRGSSKVSSTPEPEPKSRMAFKLAAAGHGITPRL